MQALRKLSGWVGAFAAASLLAACGGGGGSPGTNANGQQPSKAATVVLSASSGTIASSGQDGTEVTLTAIVKDSNNNTLPNETVSFKSSSGNISNTNRISDANGVVTEKLNVKGDTSLRDITITASAGGATSNAVTVKVVSATQTLTLTTDAGTLQSAGAAGSEVTVTALVKDSNNSVMAGVPVTLSADSGSLTNGS
ncbi:Ig-like domain-containing protein, partial [Pseudoduganella sp. RAF53_2]